MQWHPRNAFALYVQSTKALEGYPCTSTKKEKRKKKKRGGKKGGTTSNTRLGLDGTLRMYAT